MALVLILLALFVALLVGIWITSHLVGLLLMLLMAGFVGWLANKIIPGKIPYGWVGAVVFGLLGSWLGTLVLGGLGPTIFGITVIPALLGAVVLGLGASAVTRATGRRQIGASSRHRALGRTNRW